MTEIGRGIPQLSSSSISVPTPRGLYEGTYIIQPTDKVQEGKIEVLLQNGSRSVLQEAVGHVAIRCVSAARGHGDGRRGPGPYRPRRRLRFVPYRGMRVRLIGKAGHTWCIRLASTQIGWVKESALVELPAGRACLPRRSPISRRSLRTPPRWCAFSCPPLCRTALNRR